MKRAKRIGPLGKQALVLLFDKGIPFLRIYKKNHDFVDYKILHNDLSLTIDDEDAYIYELEDGELVIDHCPETLGLDDKKEKA